MFRQLRSTRKKDKCDKFNYNKLDSLIDKNRSMKNVKLYRQLNHVYHAGKSRKRGIKFNRTDHFDLKLLDTKNDNTTESDMSEPIHENDKQVIVQTEKNGNTPMEIPNQDSTTSHISRKTFKNVETITSISLQKTRTNSSSDPEPDLCVQFNDQKSVQETQNGNSKLTTSNNVISSETNKIEKNNTGPTNIQILHPTEPIGPTRVIPGINLSTQNPPSPHFAFDLTQRMHAIDVEYIDLNKKQETEFIENSYDLSSTFYVHPRNTVPSNLSASNIVQDINLQPSAPADYINSQPLFSNVTGIMHTAPQNYYYLPANNLYTNIVPNPNTQLSQKIDEIQENLKIMNQNLISIFQTQINLLNTQNSLKAEIQHLKAQTTAFENRENWLAEHGITLPMNSHSEFITFCTMLDQSPECRIIFETSINFAISSKKTLTRNISTILRKYFDSELANQFTAVRSIKEKHVIAKTSFYKHLLENFLRKSTNGIIFAKITEADFIKALGDVLCNVKYWKQKSSG